MADEIYMAMAAKPVVTNIDQASASIRTGDIQNPEVYKETCLNLGRAIDSAIAMNAVPSSHIPQFLLIVEEVYSRKTELLQPSLISLMLPVKAACKLGWFKDEDKNRLLMLAKEVSYQYSNLDKLNIEPIYADSCISNIISRFYPRMKLEHILTSFDVKAGYETFVVDFHISLGTLPHHCQDLWLLVAKMDNMETSACIVSPPNVYSFQINRKEIPKRTKDDMGEGPQLPSNVTEMVKYGVNLLQVSGDFDGEYMIALAYMNFISSPDIPELQDYVYPVCDEVDSDCEVSGTSSRVSLDCPFSQHRIKTPVKGHLCKHPQCFDYNNFMEMNSTKPLWKCPVCNYPVCNLDIRIDQDLVEILNEVADNISEVIISEDGSWMVAMSDTPNTSQENFVPENHPSPPQGQITQPADVTTDHANLTTPAVPVSPSQILNDVANDVSDVIISEDGSWMVAMSQTNTPNTSQDNPVPENPNPNNPSLPQGQITQAADVTSDPVSVHANLTTPAVSPFRDSLLQSQDSSDTVNAPPPVEQTGHHLNLTTVQPSTHQPAPSQPQTDHPDPVNPTTTTTEPTQPQPGDFPSTTNKAQRTSMFTPAQLTPCATTPLHYTRRVAEQPHHTGPSQIQVKVGSGRKRGRPRKVPSSELDIRPISPTGLMRGALQGKDREAARLQYASPPRQSLSANKPWSLPTPTVPVQVALMEQYATNLKNPSNSPH